MTVNTLGRVRLHAYQFEDVSWTLGDLMRLLPQQKEAAWRQNEEDSRRNDGQDGILESEGEVEPVVGLRAKAGLGRD